MVTIFTIFFLFVYCVLESCSRDGKASRKYKKIIFNPDMCILKIICLCIVLALLIINRFIVNDVVTLAENPISSVLAYALIIGLIIASIFEIKQSKKTLKEMKKQDDEENNEACDNNI